MIIKHDTLISLISLALGAVLIASSILPIWLVQVFPILLRGEAVTTVVVLSLVLAFSYLGIRFVGFGIKVLTDGRPSIFRECR
jgi:hypothetical protein